MATGLTLPTDDAPIAVPAATLNGPLPQMTELLYAGLLLLILLGASALGLMISPHLSEHHRSRETIEVVWLVVTMLVTFAAIVLGLLTTSVKSSFDAVGAGFRTYGGELTELDRLLRDYGDDARPVRRLLRHYTTATIGAFWPDEPAPAGGELATGRRRVEPGSIVESGPPERILSRIGRMIDRFEPSDDTHRRLAERFSQEFRQLMKTRWNLLEQEGGSISTPFYWVMTFWLVIIFAAFGLSAPRNLLVYLMIGLGALSIVSAVYVILDLDTPFHGIFKIPSQPMRDALAAMAQ
jgi:uncharacterized protein DUF4239